MAKKEKFAKNKNGKVPFAVLRKGALCALLGTTVLAGGALVGCDEGSFSGPPGAKFYYGAEQPDATKNPGKNGDFYIETADGDVWQYQGNDGWIYLTNIRGPQGESPEITISEDGYWVINGFKTDTLAQGENGVDAQAPTVEIQDGYWVINGTKSDVKAEAVDGKSAFDLAVEHEDFKGTVAEWLASLKGAQGERGYYVTSVNEVKDDNWGISSHFEFTLNDEAKTVVSTESVSKLMPNYYYGATTGAEVLELIELGAENIQIENDVDVTEAIVLKGNLSIDLNNHTFTYSNGSQIVVDNGIEFEFKDGEMVFETKGPTTSSIKVQGGSSLVLDRVEYVSTGTNVMVIEDATSVKVVDSHLTGKVYCVGTNASTEENFGVKIEIDDCEFDTTGGYEYNGAYWYDTTPILINIPCEATIKDSKITGHRQAVIVRGGNVVIEDCELINTCKDINGLGLKYNDQANAWGQGNEVAMATLVVGNDGTGIYNKYATNLTLTNVKINTKKTSVPSIFAIGNDGENLGTNIIINTDLEEEVPTTVIANNYAHLTFAVDSAKDLLNVAKEVIDERNVIILEKGFVPSIVLTQDVNEDIYLTFDEFSRYGVAVPEFADFIQNAEEYDFNVNLYAEISNDFEVAVLLDAMEYMPEDFPPFISLKNNIDLADIFEMMGETTLSPEMAEMINGINQYVVRSEEGDSIKDMYRIYCSLPQEVSSADEIAGMIEQAMMTQAMPGKISLQEEVEFNDVLERMAEIMMSQQQGISEGEMPEGGLDGEMGEGQMPGEMPMPPLYQMMPTADIYLEIRKLCTPETRDNLVWTEGNEIVSVSTGEGLEFAIDGTEAKQVILMNAVECNTAIVVDREVELDLCGNSISIPNDKAGDGVFHVVSGGKLTINDSMGWGTINGVGKNDYNMALWADGGEIIINGGTYTNEEINGTDDHYDIIYAKNGGVVTIKGGTFACYTPKWTLNLKDNDGSQIIVKGGTFKNYDPSSSHTENPVANFVDPQYTVTVSEEDMNGDIWYAVVPGLGQMINNPENGGYVYLDHDITTTSESVDAKTVITKDTIINFADSIVNLDIPNATSATENWCAINVNDGNVVFEGYNGGVTTAANGELYAVTVRNGANLTINGGNYIGGTTAINVVQGTLTINGGFFASRIDGDEESNGRWTINCYDANYRNGTAVVVITGGTFVNFNPADNLCEGEKTNYVAEGYKVVEEKQENGDIWYRVVPA